MKQKLVLALAGIAVVVVTGTLIWNRSAAKQNARSGSAPVQKSDWLVAGPGRVEPESEDIKLAAEMSGKLKAVLVEEGDAVRRGQVLAELVNDDYQAQVAADEADVKRKEAQLRKMINGARLEERRQASSSVAEAEAVVDNTRSLMQRYATLFAAGVVSREEAERYSKEYEVAKAQYEVKIQNHALINGDAREEDRSMAEAELESARARLEEARAVLGKTYIRAPIDGVILRKHHRAGESVSSGLAGPDPILTMGDSRALRVRVDVDEADVSRLSLGQKAYITADAYGNRKFWGRVVRVGQELGRKNVRTDEPTEHVDTKILETLIQLDNGVTLPIGLRVDAFIVADPEQTARK